MLKDTLSASLLHLKPFRFHHNTYISFRVLVNQQKRLSFCIRFKLNTLSNKKPPERYWPMMQTRTMLSKNSNAFLKIDLTGVRKKKGDVPGG